jgi:sugar transferase (PEP-CTERM/EpsH1 system associated)
VAQYVEHVRDVPKILDFGDMDSQKWLEYANYKPFPLSLGYTLEGRKMLRAEKRLARRFDLCTATTRAEWQTLEDYGTGAATDWFPNGVDAEFFSPTDGGFDPDTISFIGRMDYYPNQECMARFCREVWPLLKARRPAMKLSIVGADPTPAMRALGELPGVTVTGSVPDVRPHVRASALMVAPLAIARGTQNKILEAMAMGVPVVTSPAAAGGVDAERDSHLLVADSADGIAQAILRIVENPAERERLAVAGRARMLSHHAWPRSMQRLDAIIENARHAFASRRVNSLEGAV